MNSSGQNLHTPHSRAASRPSSSTDQWNVNSYLSN